MKSPASTSTSSDFFSEQHAEIINLYKEHIPVYLSDLLCAVKEENQEQIIHHSHKMCSAMKTIGFTEAAELLERIERKNPVRQELNKMVDALEQLVNDSLKELDEIRQK